MGTPFTGHSFYGAEGLYFGGREMGTPFTGHSFYGAEGLY
jgi:hypothetical protein